MAGDIAFILVPETVLALADRDLASHPEGAPQTGIAELGDLGLATELAGLLRRQIEAAELQELALMAKRCKSPASANAVRALIGPIPGIVFKRP